MSLTSQVRLVLEWQIPPHIAEVAFEFFSQLEVDLLAYSHTNQCQHYCTLENQLPMGALG